MLLKIFYYGTTVWGHSKMEKHFSWWRHQMDTFSALPALCERNPPVTGRFPSQRPVTRSFDIFFDLRLNKRLSKQSKLRWFEIWVVIVGNQTWHLPTIFTRRHINKWTQRKKFQGFKVESSSNYYVMNCINRKWKEQMEHWNGETGLIR